MAFELFQSENNSKYYFRLKAKNGEIVLQSEAYDQKEGAENGIQSVITNAADAANFENREAKNGKSYFVLKAGNGQIIGKSQMYSSTSGHENGIQSVMKNAAAGGLKDMTA